MTGWTLNTPMADIIKDVESIVNRTDLAVIEFDTLIEDLDALAEMWFESVIDVIRKWTLPYQEKEQARHCSLPPWKQDDAWGVIYHWHELSHCRYHWLSYEGEESLKQQIKWGYGDVLYEALVQISNAYNDPNLMRNIKQDDNDSSLDLLTLHYGKHHFNIWRVPLDEAFPEVADRWDELLGNQTEYEQYQIRDNIIEGWRRSILNAELFHNLRVFQKADEVVGPRYFAFFDTGNKFQFRTASKIWIRKEHRLNENKDNQSLVFLDVDDNKLWQLAGTILRGYIDGRGYEQEPHILSPDICSSYGLRFIPFSRDFWGDSPPGPPLRSGEWQLVWDEEDAFFTGEYLRTKPWIRKFPCDDDEGFSLTPSPEGSAVKGMKYKIERY